MALKEILSRDGVGMDNGCDKKKPNKVIIWMIIAALIILAISSFFEGDNDEKVNLEESETEISEYAREQERKLESILKKINGAGNVSVFISVEGGGEKVLAMDSKNKLSEESSENSDMSKSEESENNVFTIGSRSDGEPYVVKEKTPEIAGVIVVATGAADEKVRLEIYDAVRAVYGIAPHRIKITY